jgi:hypothetical protein
MPNDTQKIHDATTMNELNKLEEKIQNSIHHKNNGTDKELLEMIKNKKETMNDNISDEGRLSVLADAAAEAQPPPAKRAKNDDTLKNLINKKANAEYNYYKNKSGMEMHVKSRAELKSHMDGFLINDDDVGDDMLTSLTLEVDRRIHAVKDVKMYADYWNITYMIKSYELEMKKHKKIYDESVKELNDYQQNN